MTYCGENSELMSNGLCRSRSIREKLQSPRSIVCGLTVQNSRNGPAWPTSFGSETSNSDTKYPGEPRKVFCFQWRLGYLSIRFRAGSIFLHPTLRAPTNNPPHPPSQFQLDPPTDLTRFAPRDRVPRESMSNFSGNPESAQHLLNRP
jgi:hypothetical protein